jgi:probable F420-dependent oxidoreductase
MGMSPHAPPDPQLSLFVQTFASEGHHGDWQEVLDLAVAADTAGVDRLLVSDHVAYGEHLEAYGRPELGGVMGGTQPTGPDGHWLEPLTFLAAISGITTRVRLATNILQAALRRPIVLAKTAATLDVLSRGRLDLGVGVGWQREEYEAAGLDFDARGSLLDDTLSVLQDVWTNTRITVNVPSLRFDGIHQWPKPVQAGGVPIWVSGRINRPVVRRIIRFGTGWIPWGDEAAQLVESVPAMKTAIASAGGDPSTIQVCGNVNPVMEDNTLDLGATMAQVPRLLSAGVTDVRLRLGSTPPRGRQRLTNYLADVVAAFHRVSR